MADQEIKSKVQELVRKGRGYSEIKAVAGTDSWVCVLAGQIKARANDVPRALEGGDYHTHNWGRLATIEQSTLQVGDVVQIQGESYEVIANESARGDVHMPSTMWFVAMKVYE